MDDLISRHAAIMHFVKASKSYECGMFNLAEVTHELWQLPSAEKRTNKRTETHECDYISRKDAIDEIEERKNANGYSNVVLISELNRLEGYIMRLPSAEPERTGRWIEDSGNMACSICHTIWLYRRTSYCPNCGAKMEVEHDNK